MKSEKDSKPLLLHPSLHAIPQSIRFLIAGLVNNVLFLVSFNSAVYYLDQWLVASTIYSLTSILLIPIGHAVASLLVFGWPSSYLPSLLSNAPIGLTATAIGTVSTGLLDKISFNEKAASIIGPWISKRNEDKGDKSELYSSVVVMVITGLWSYVLSIIVNKPSSKAQSKGDKEL